MSAGTVWIKHTIIRVASVGLIRKGTKTATGERMLRLPAFAVAVLRRGKLSSGGRGPVFPDRAGLTARQIADQLGHAKVSMTQDRYLGRRAGDPVISLNGLATSR